MEDTFSKGLDRLGTYTRSATDILKLIIIESRYNVRASLESCHSKSELGSIRNGDIADLKSRVRGLLFEILPVYIRSYNEDKYNELKQKLNSDKLEDIEALINEINKFLDKLGLIQFDKQSYDTTITDIEDKHYGV